MVPSQDEERASRNAKDVGEVNRIEGVLNKDVWKKLPNGEQCLAEESNWCAEGGAKSNNG